MNFSSSSDASRPSYTVVYDTVQEKRFHVVHQTVNETVMKPVTKTCYKNETKTCYKSVSETAYKTVQETVNE